MQFRTVVDIPASTATIAPCTPVVLVGSCFAAHIGRRMHHDAFATVVNPDGVMYNPVSILHSVERICASAARVPTWAILTLGTNHAYRLRSTGEIVDNCAKRPASLFAEEVLTVDECVQSLAHAVGRLAQLSPDIRVIITVSPIRYAKYGFHGSQLSKATLMLAADALVKAMPQRVSYFPAYELLNDELRDYRFYAADMLHPSEQAVDYIYERFGETYFGEATRRFLARWHPIRSALAHKPFHPDSEEYRLFREGTLDKARRLAADYPDFSIPE